jgi:hypothetical protein
VKFQIIIGLTMETVISCETSVSSYHTTWRHISEDSSHIHFSHSLGPTYVCMKRSRLSDVLSVLDEGAATPLGLFEILFS